MSEDKKTEGLEVSLETKEDKMSLDYLVDKNSAEVTIRLILATKQENLFNSVNELLKFLKGNKLIMSIKSVSTGGK